MKLRINVIDAGAAFERRLQGFYASLIGHLIQK